MAQPKAALPSPAPRVFDPGNPLPTARAFIEDDFQNQRHRTLLHHGGQFYSWNGICYQVMESRTISAMLYKYLEPASQSVRKNEWKPFAPTAKKVREVVRALEAETHLPTNVIAIPAWLGSHRHSRPDAREIIACSNGLLHLPTLKLLPSTPAFFSTNALSFPYDPGAPEPARWLKFLGELWPSDPESISTLQEIFGYFLVPGTRQQKIFLIIGPKRSGKGTIGRVLRGLLGQNNVCAPTLASFSQNFGLQPLIGKQLAIISDARLSPRPDQQVIAERLLSISGEDALTIDRKYLPAWTGQLFCRILVLTNVLPRISDPSGAFASRFIVLRLTESFYGREDQTLTDSLLCELPGILNWATEGWQRLRERGHFVQPTSATGQAQKLQDLGSPIEAFIRDRCVTGHGRTVVIAKLFAEYKSWCAERDFEAPPDVQTFGSLLREVQSEIEAKQRRIGGKPIWHYIGIGLR